MKIRSIMMAIVEDTMIMGMCMTIEWYQLFIFTYSNFRIIYDLSVITILPSCGIFYGVT